MRKNMDLEKVIDFLRDLKRMPLYLYEYEEYEKITVTEVEVRIKNIDFYCVCGLESITFIEEDGEDPIYLEDLNSLLENRNYPMMYSMKNDEETLNRFRRLIIREQELVIQKQMNRKKDAEWMIPEAKKIIQNLEGEINANKGNSK